MDSKIVCSSLLLLLCAAPLGHTIQCFRCSDEASCKNPSYGECTASYASRTANFLNQYFQGVKATSSNTFDCLRMNLTTPTTTTLFAGCIYSSMYGCGYALKAEYDSESLFKDCFQCNNYNGCNHADSLYTSLAVLVLPFLFVLKCVLQ